MNKDKTSYFEQTSGFVTIARFRNSSGKSGRIYRPYQNVPSPISFFCSWHSSSASGSQSSKCPRGTFLKSILSICALNSDSDIPLRPRILHNLKRNTLFVNFRIGHFPSPTHFTQPKKKYTFLSYFLFHLTGYVNVAQICTFLNLKRCH